MLTETDHILKKRKNYDMKILFFVVCYLQLNTDLYFAALR